MSGWYEKFKGFQSGAGAIDMGSADIRLLLIDLGAYTPDYVNDEFVADIPAAAIRERTGALTGQTWSGNAVFDSDPVDTDGSDTGTECEAVVGFQHTGSDATARLIWLDDGFPPVTTVGAGITVTPDAQGWGKM